MAPPILPAPTSTSDRGIKPDIKPPRIEPTKTGSVCHMEKAE
jgi:hypothetical protein